MRVIPLLLFAVIFGCTSIRPIADQTFTQRSLSEQLEVGDRIIVHKQDGEQYRDFRINSIEQDYLLGRTDQVDPLIIPYSSIENLEKYHHSVAKTGVVILTLIVGVVALGAFSYGL